jgi:hypothetical protein
MFSFSLLPVVFLTLIGPRDGKNVLLTLIGRLDVEVVSSSLIGPLEVHIFTTLVGMTGRVLTTSG